MTRMFLRATGALFVAITLGGCAFMARQAFAPPLVDVRDVRLAGIGVQGGRIDVRISIYNPNDYRMDASNIHYKMLLDTLQVAEGSIEQHVTLLPKDSISIKVPVNFGLKQIMAAGQELSKTGSLPFRLTGDVLLLTTFGNVRRAFEQQGTYDGLNMSLLPRKK